MQITKSEIVKIITAIKVQCPEALQYKTETDFDILVNMWFDCFKEYPQEVVWKATQNALMHNEYQKKNWLGAISSEIEKMQCAYEKDDNELWAELQDILREVSRCASMFRYTYKDGDDGLTQGERAWLQVDNIFNNLDPALKEYCRNKRGLIELAQYTGEQTSYERGRFMRIMPTIRERIKTRHETPENVKQLLQSMVDKMQIKTIDGNPLKLQ